MNILIAGDVVPMRRTINLFKQKQTLNLFGEIMCDMQETDLNVVNFEAPIVFDPSVKPIEKSGPALSTTIETMEVLKEAGFNMVTLANNHFRDYGQIGVQNTIDAAEKLAIDYVGGGKTQSDSRKIYYYENSGKTLAIINVCEHEFSIATEDYGGSNPLDLVNAYEDITEARKKADYVMMIIHGGVEHYQLPTPRMKRWYHYFIDLGVDAIVNHHQHCISGYEYFKGKPILYGLGNLCFDSFKENSKDTIWNYGYMAIISFGDAIDFKAIPYKNCTINKAGVSAWNQEEFEREIQRLNDIILDDERLNSAYVDYAKLQKNSLLKRMIPFNSRLFNACYRTGFLGEPYSKEYSIMCKNQLMCESHYELTSKIFELLSR